SQLLDQAERGERLNVAAAVNEWSERETYSQALRLANGDQSKIAKWLGVSRPTVRQKLLRYELRPSRQDASAKPANKSGNCFAPLREFLRYALETDSGQENFTR